VRVAPAPLPAREAEHFAEAEPAAGVRPLLVLRLLRSDFDRRTKE